MEKCKKVLEVRYQARLMPLNKHAEEDQKRYEVARKATSMQAGKKV
jgi:hypothetical protein